MENIKMEFESVENLIPYANNARKHGDEDVDAIMASIKEFGFNDPIGVWKNIIVEGHGRLIAAKRLGIDKVPVVRLDHLTDEQRRAYALAHNKTAELSGWDFEILDSEIEDISDIDMGQFGFKPGGPGGGGDPGEVPFRYEEQYAVTVICHDEEDQRAVYERLTAEGYECKVVVV